MKKAQIEITNIIFMHLMGLIGILTFTLLFVSLISSSSARAEGLSEETLYYNYGRRLISSSDCLAYNYISVHYSGVGFESSSRILPGIVDMSKFFDYNHQNCLRYDLVSGAFEGDYNNPLIAEPILVYEVNVKDLVSEEEYGFVSNAYQSSIEAQVYDICKVNNCQPGCLFDCEDLLAYVNNEITFDEAGSTSLSCYQQHEIGYEDLNEVKTLTVNPGVNCWTEEFNNAQRFVHPYDGKLDCSIGSSLIKGGIEVGNVYETSLKYSVNLRYPGELDDFEMHPGIMNVKFCILKIPTMCDPFYGDYNFGFDEGFFEGFEVYQPEVCEALGLPLI